MENHAIATMMTYFGSTDHGLGTEVDRWRGGTSSKNRLESPLYIYIYIYTSPHEQDENKVNFSGEVLIIYMFFFDFRHLAALYRFFASK